MTQNAVITSGPLVNATTGQPAWFLLPSGASHAINRNRSPAESDSMIETTPTIEQAKALAPQLATRAAEADRQGTLPIEDIQALREAGFFALSVPQDHGGLGLSLGECVAAYLELAQGSASSALVAVMPLQVFGHAREIRPWPEPMFAQLCQAAVQHGALLNNVASEPQLGSPARGGTFETYAKSNPEGTRWVVNGHKTWTTGGRHITHMLVRLRVEDEPGLMLVRQDTPGVTWEETWIDALSLRASDSHDVHFAQVDVPINTITCSNVAPSRDVRCPMPGFPCWWGRCIWGRRSPLDRR
ncbi:MAG: acyl-CoA/acyl-ACP dehydrogenase [bacterium]|nr:acyl-CoA/acyl-ACP dehydrogenase [bacterium]